MSTSGIHVPHGPVSGFGREPSAREAALLTPPKVDYSSRVQKTLEEQAAQLRLALEMHEFGVSMKRESLKRRYPEESPAQIEERLRRWLRQEPEPDSGNGAEQ